MMGIHAKGISAGYGDKSILSSIDIAFEDQKFSIIAGPNGTGKTTLLTCLAGLAKPTSGEVFIGKKRIAKLGRKEIAKKIAYLPQSVESAFDLKVREVVLMGRAPHLGMLGVHGDEDQSIADEAMAFTDVSHLAQRNISALSGGERQRVFISRAVCQQTDFILLDEPTSALDPAHQLRIMELMNQLKTQRGTGIIMVSHDLNLAAMYADTLCLLHKGRIAAMGTPEEILTAPQLSDVYGCAIEVEKSRNHGLIHVTPLPERLTKTKQQHP